TRGLAEAVAARSHEVVVTPWRSIVLPDLETP
ncbi:MAG: hypothetical protein JWR55_2456, partial [Aeromicrobium sp.]|nr:hypothetical protein [Aeromicrobium sp.]